MDFGPKFTKFGTELPQLPKNPNKHKYLKQIFYKWGKNPKNLLGVFSQVKIGLKKTSRQKNCFLATLVALDFTLVSETLGRSFKLA